MTQGKQKLSEKLAIFIKEYRKDRNASRAAIAAGYSPKGAGVQGCRFLKDPKIQSEIAKQDADLAKSLDLSVEWVLKRLMMRADFDVRDFYNADGTLKDVKDLPHSAAFALQGVEIEKLYEHFAKGQSQNTGTLTKIKYADRDRALELLGRHLKMFTDKMEFTGDEELVKRLVSGRQRATA